MIRRSKSLLHKGCYEDAHSEHLGVSTLGRTKMLTLPKMLTEDAHLSTFGKTLGIVGIFTEGAHFTVSTRVRARGEANQRLLFDQPPHEKCPVIGHLPGCRPAPPGRQWLRSFLAPEQCPPERKPAIVPSKFRANATSAKAFNLAKNVPHCTLVATRRRGNILALPHAQHT